MLNNPISLFRDMVRKVGFFLRSAGRHNYRVLHEYLLKINEYKKLDDVLVEVATCLKDLLDYELFGFAMRNEGSLDVWIDPRIHSKLLMEKVKTDFPGQKLDASLHFFAKNAGEKSQKTGASHTRELLSYSVMDDECTALLYLVPGKKLLINHSAMLNMIVRSLRVALENYFCIKKLENLAAVDPLTGCYNRRALDKYIENDIAYAKRYGQNLSVILFDLDDFKAINDSCGHAAGDMVLKEVSGLVASLVRKSDFFGRYGGEEFVLVLPDTGRGNAVLLAEKLRKKLASFTMSVGGRTINVTASFGVASLGVDGDSATLLREADKMLYFAKSRGKNAVMPKVKGHAPVRTAAARRGLYQAGKLAY